MIYDMICDMIWYIRKLQLGSHSVAVVQYTYTHKTNNTYNTKIRKSVGRAPSLRVLPWHLPYNWGNSTEKPQSGWPYINIQQDRNKTIYTLIKINLKNMKECDNSKIHISSNFIRGGYKNTKWLSRGTPWLGFPVLRGIFVSRVCYRGRVLQQWRPFYITFSRVRTLFMTDTSPVTIEGLVLVVCVHVKLSSVPAHDTIGASFWLPFS
jgi:hypothetical protein